MPIFDQGYQHWTGTLSGHTWRWLAITRQGVRIGLKNRYLRMVLLMAWMPALILVVMLCIWGLVERNSDLVVTLLGFLKGVFGPNSIAEPKHYRVEVWTLCYHFFLQYEMWFALLLVLLVGPQLISADMRFNALPLYLSRPLRRIDYFLGKLGIIVAFIGMIVIVPALIAYILGLLFSLDITIVKDTFGILLASIAYGLVIALSAGLLMLALSSLSRNSRYVALFWIGILIVGWVTASVLGAVEREQRMHAAFRNNQRPSRDKLVAIESEGAQDDWRPIVSYTANLSRIGAQLLGTGNCLESLNQWMPAEQRAQSYSYILGPQFPWTWSAGVLLGIFGLSACILNFRIKSLDRLK